jgi:uncharacterized membrane protein
VPFFWTTVRPQLSTALRLVVAAWVLSALTQLVVHAAEFSHDQRYLSLLAQHALEGWSIMLAWLLLLRGRLRLAPEESRGLLLAPVPYGAALTWLLFVLVSPFTNAYFTHLTHPTLAMALVWGAWPVFGLWHAFLADRLGRSRLAARPGWHLGAAAAMVTGVVFVQSYRRHLWFGSGGKDLGLFHQTVWLLSRGESPENTVMGMHAFADHLELIDFLAVPLQWLWPSAGSLLLFQALAVGAGAVPLFDLARRKLGSLWSAWAMVAVYLFALDQQHAVMFDWNPTTCGAALLPWVVWFFERERPLGFGLSVLVVALAKENLVLYAFGLCLTLALAGPRRRWALSAAALLAVAFIVEMSVVFPAFRPEGFRHLRFEGLGTSPAAMVQSLVESPYRAFSLLFTPGAKIDGLLLPFSTVAFVCLLSPRWLLAMAPAILERFWSTHANRWWGHHYGAGVGVLAVLAGIEGLCRLRDLWPVRGRPRMLAMAVATVLSSCLLVGTLGRFGPGPLVVWRQPYFASPENRADAEAMLARVPADAAVAAQNHLLAHLSGRRSIYQLVRGDGAGPIPVHADFVAGVADYVALDLEQSAWPREAGFPRALARELLTRGYGVEGCWRSAVLLRRGAYGVLCPQVTD